MINCLCISGMAFTSTFDIGLLLIAYTILSSSPVHLAKQWSIMNPVVSSSTKSRHRVGWYDIVCISHIRSLPIPTVISNRLVPWRLSLKNIINVNIIVLKSFLQISNILKINKYTIFVEIAHLIVIQYFVFKFM